ncbi:MAG TPA: DinB family protein [Mycobacteriales bacterium]|nr:DinB family protein [Mycobacteriales bacterium]
MSNGHEEHPSDGRQVGPLLLESLDYVWDRVHTRLAGLSQEEYLWEPAPGCWSVRRTGDGAGDGWRADRQRPEPEPAPVTTIAWRLWHIGAECLADYTERGLGDWPLEVRDTGWYGQVDEALGAVDTAWTAFRAGLGRLGEEGMWGLLGEQWGPYAKGTWAGLVLHAQDELSHHGAEVALLRDLYARRTPG